MNQLYCSNCGQLIPSSSNFCTYCGAPQHGKGASAFRAQSATVNDSNIVNQMANNAINHEHNNNAQAQESNKSQQNNNNSNNINGEINNEPYIPKQHLGSDSIVYFFISYVSSSILLLLLIIIGLVFLPALFIFGLIGYVVVVGIIAVVVHNNYLYEIDRDGLKIEKGVLYKYHVSVPFEQIQNVNIERSILDRILGFAKISVETAGGSTAPGIGGATPKAEAYIPAIHLDQAKKIHDLLLDGADGTVDGVYSKK